MRVLVTRPAADAAELAAALRAHGHEVIFDPLLTTSEEPGAAAVLERSLPGVQAVVFTSPNGVRSFAAASRRRDVPVIALGDATTAAARAAHFGEIESVDGDVEVLTSLVAGRLNPLGGALLVVTGAEVGRDLARALGAAGFSVRRVALYRAEPAQAFSSKVVAGFKSGTLDAAVFFSPGTATVFARLISTSGFASACEGMTAVVTSPAVGAALKSVAWDNLVVAHTPTQAAILEAFGEPLPQTRPEMQRADVGPERMAASPANSGPADKAVLAPPPETASPAPSRMASAATETFAPRKRPVARADWSRGRSAAPMLFVLAAFLVAVATSPYWAISLAAYLPWVAPGDSGVVLAKVNEINARLDALDQRLDRRVTELAARATGSEDAAHRADAVLTEDGRHLDTLDKGLAALSTRVDSANNTAGDRASSIEEQVRKLQADIGTQNARLDGLDKGLAVLSTSAGKTEQDAQKLAAALADQHARLDALDKRLQALAASTDATASAAIGRVSALEDQVRKLSASLGAQSDRLAAIGTRVETLAIAIDTANASAASLRNDTQKLGAALKTQGDRLEALSNTADAANAAAAKLADQAQKLGATLTEHGDKLGALAGQSESARAAASSQAANSAAQAARLDLVDRRLDTLGAAANSASAAEASLGSETGKLSAALADHASRIELLEKRSRVASDSDLASAAPQGRAAGLLDKTDVALSFAVDALRARLMTSKPFAEELQTAEGLAEQRPEALAALRTLDERAPQGIPSLAALVYRFSLVARDVRRDEAAKRQGIVAGRGGDPNAQPGLTGAEAALAATEAALRNEDLASAVSALRQLEPARTESVEPWIREAEARLRAETTLVTLDANLARRVRESGSGAAAKP